jgi:hypothetical protein
MRQEAMPTPRTVILAVLAGVVFWLALGWLRRRVGLAILRSFARHGPRPQPLRFVLLARDAFFASPFATMELLFGDGRDALAKKLWHDARAPARHIGDTDLPADGLHVHRTHLADGRAIAVIVCPWPQRKGEPYFVATVLPTDPALRADVPRARGESRFFYLNRGSSTTGRETDLCGWTPDGQQRWYNVGAPLDPDGFAAAVGEKLRELGL